MKFEEIEKYAESLKARLGATETEYGLADKAITYGNYKQMRESYDAILNDLLVLIRELASNLKPADEPSLPKAGNFHND
jgi:hypothetical protein